MLTPQTPPLSSCNLLDTQQAPLRNWIQLAVSSHDLERLLQVVGGVPGTWIAWAEQVVQTAELRGHKVASPLGFRLSVLVNGIVLLQECKYVCDLLENSLRCGFASWAIGHKVCQGQLCAAIPEWEYRDQRFAGTVVDGRFSMGLKFYQLTETIARHWRHIPPADGRSCHVPGFGGLFRADRRCRDVSCFRRDMGEVRRTRNDVAHSRRLFRHSEINGLYRRVSMWIRPLGFDLVSKIREYRVRRPRFLEDLKSVIDS